MPTNPIPAVPIPAPRYYPRLSEIITVDDLPEFLSFVENGLNAIFENIHYKNLQYSKGYRGDSAFYSLDIVTSTKLAIPLPFDLALVLNPDVTGGDSSISSFPITLEYQWEILAFIKTFSSSNFSFSLDDFYSLGLQVFRISEEQVVAHMLNIFVEASDAITKYDQLLKDINELPSIVADPTFQELKFPAGAEKSIKSTIALIKNNPKITKSIPLLLFAVYISKELTSDLEGTKQRLQEFYNIIAPDGIEAHLKRIITPKAKATLVLSAGIEFPKNILRPVTEQGANWTDPEAKSIFVFAEAQLYADTEAGIGYQFEMGGSLEPSKYAMIGKTGLILQLDTLKLDLSKKTNIPEADADGRPNDFVGAYARAVSVTLPSKWFHEPTETLGNTATTLRIGASDLLVGSGGLSGNIYLETVPRATGIPFNYFIDKFDFIYPITMFETSKTDGIVKDKIIDNYGALLTYLQGLNTAGLPYSFKFPLTLKTNANLVSSSILANKVYTFNTAQEYQVFLSGLYENVLWKNIGSPTKGFKVGFEKFDITFKQNKVISSNIKGALEINKFKYPKGHLLEGKPMHVDIEGHLYDEGDFNLTASFQKGSEPEANLFDFVNFKFNSLELGKQDDDYYIGTACEINFTNDVMKQFMGDQSIIIEKLRIYSDGNIELEGGSIPIPLNLSLNLGPVQMAVSNINFGSTQIVKDGVPRKYNFWGFDGAISINPLGLDARGEGVKYYYTTDNGEKDSFLRIQTIEVDLMIPGTATAASAMAIIHGMISLPEPGKSQEFIGEVSLKLPKAKISGGVGMRFMPKYPAFLVDAHIELPTPIPLGFISIAGFRGLLGFRYVATKQAIGLTTEDSWYEFYKHPKPGINIRKFSGPPDSLKYNSPFSIGAGATFVTTADGGHVLSLRAMLLLSLPTLFYIEAGLNVIAGRLGLIEDDPSNPPFFAMVAFGDDSLELAAGADFSIPKDSGEIFQLHALLESGFFFKNQKPWYVNLGSRKDPITARVLSLFTAKSFIMISAQGIEAGARLDFTLKQSFGPAKVELWAYLELGGKISFKRPQMGGYITAGGGIKINIWIINVEIVLDTIFSVESFKPFLIYAKIELSVRIRFFGIKVRKNFKIELQWDINRIIDRTAFSPLPLGTEGDKGEGSNPGDDRSKESVKGVHMLTNEAFPLYFSQSIPGVNDITQTIPLDTFIDIKLAKGVNPDKSLSNKIGGFTSPPNNYVVLMPPDDKAAGRPIRQVRHEFAIKNIELKSWISNNASNPNDPTSGYWADYHPFEAVVEKEDRTKVQDLPWAFWQKAMDQYDSIRVLGTNPFSFLSAGEPGWHVPEQYGITPSKMFCESAKIKKDTINFLNKKIGERYYVPTQYEADRINGLYFKLIGEAAVIELNGASQKEIKGDFMSITGENNPRGFNRSLSFKNYNDLEIIFPQGAIEPSLTITTHAKEIKIKAYTAVFENDAKFATYKEVDLKKFSTDTVITKELKYTKNELLNTITLYDTQTNAYLKPKIDKIVISPVAANADRIKKIRNILTSLVDTIYENDLIVDKDAAVTILINSAEYIALELELATLKADAGNENIITVGTPQQNTFTRFYGYKGKTPLTFDQVYKYNGTYLITFHPQGNTTAIVQINANGKILRERLLNGVVTSMQVVNDNLVLTQALDADQCKGISKATIDKDLIVGCSGPIAATAIIELDAELNQNFGLQYTNTYSLGFNKLITLANNELLWVNTLENETQINWVDGSNRSIVRRFKISAVASKLLQHSSTDFSLITKDKKIIRISIDAITKAVSVIDTKVVADTAVAEITDAVIAYGKIVLTVKMANGEFGLAQVNGSTIKIITNNTNFKSALHVSDNTLSDGKILAYNDKYLFIFNDLLQINLVADRNIEIDPVQASIIAVKNEPSANEILMLSNKPNEKGVYFSLFNNQFDNCSLHPSTAPIVVSSDSTLTNSTTVITELGNVLPLAYKRRIKNSKLITTSDVICSNGSNSGEDEELEYTTCIQEIGWLTKENAIYNTNIPGYEAVQADNKAMEKATKETVQPVWRPNTTYYLHFALEDNVSDRGPVKFDYYYGFKTLGPVGHFPIPDLEPIPGQLPAPKNSLTDLGRSPLASLRQYIDYNRSYPNADGSFLQAKPAYYGSNECKVSLYFTNPYVYHMLKNWEQYGDTDSKSRKEILGAINITIKDPLNDVLINYPLTEINPTYPVPNASGQDLGWKDDKDPRIPHGIQLLNNLIKPIKEQQETGANGEDPIIHCNLVIGGPIKPKSYSYVVELTNLKPSKLYTLLLNNFFDGEQKLVHQYGFQTSRYKNFEEQIQSYLIDPEKPNKALFNVNASLGQTQIDALYHLVSQDTQPNTLSDSIATKYQDAFDRAVEGVLKLSPLDPAQRTEINRIIDTNTGNIVALLIRNPEPFNIPKMPLKEIKDTITVVDITLDGTKEIYSKKAGYSVLHSKDYSQVLLMHSDKVIAPEEDLNFRFEYRMWNNDSVEIDDPLDPSKKIVPLTLFVEDEVLKKYK